MDYWRKAAGTRGSLHESCIGSRNGTISVHSTNSRPLNEFSGYRIADCPSGTQERLGRNEFCTGVWVRNPIDNMFSIKYS
jgi:hypothetical protein